MNRSLGLSLLVAFLAAFLVTSCDLPPQQDSCATLQNEWLAMGSPECEGPRPTWYNEKICEWRVFPGLLCDGTNWGTPPQKQRCCSYSAECASHAAWLAQRKARNTN